MSVDANTTHALLNNARAGAQELGKSLSIAIVDYTGFMLLFERMEGARPMSAQIATAKAYSAAIMQRPTSALERLWTSEPLFFEQVSRMGYYPIMAAKGGYPLSGEGLILGGIGISGASGDEDHQVAEAAVAAAGFSVDF